MRVQYHESHLVYFESKCESFRKLNFTAREVISPRFNFNVGTDVKKPENIEVST